MKPDYLWNFWTVVSWMVLKFSLWSLSHLLKNLISFYSKYKNIIYFKHYLVPLPPPTFLPQYWLLHCVIISIPIFIIYLPVPLEPESGWIILEKNWSLSDHLCSINCSCRISNISSLEAVCKRNDLISHLIDHPGDWTPVIADWLLHLVTRGLGKRVDMLCYKPQAPCQVTIRS